MVAAYLGCLGGIAHSGLSAVSLYKIFIVNSIAPPPPCKQGSEEMFMPNHWANSTT